MWDSVFSPQSLLQLAATVMCDAIPGHSCAVSLQKGPLLEVFVCTSDFVLMSCVEATVFRGQQPVFRGQAPVFRGQQHRFAVKSLDPSCSQEEDMKFLQFLSLLQFRFLVLSYMNWPCLIAELRKA
ncbi:UNVERIFIED_CONTAM: hypothetical protein K2H54_060296 [Gekko kuhli]